MGTHESIVTVGKSDLAAGCVREEMRAGCGSVKTKLLRRILTLAQYKAYVKLVRPPVVGI